MTPLVACLQTAIAASTFQLATHSIFKLIYVLSKVRGYKTVLRFLSHDVTEYEPILNYFDVIPVDGIYWESRYVLLLWLSLVVLVTTMLSLRNSRFRSTSTV